MKGKIRSVVAVLAILMLVVTLAPLADTELATAAPSLGMWEAVTTPGAPGTNTVGAFDVNGMAVGPDGMTIYVADGQTPSIQKSTNGGRTFTALGNPGAGPLGAFTAPVRLIAVAPDNPNVVAVVDSFNAGAGFSDGQVYVSETGGASWGALPGVTGGAGGLNRVMDLAVGPQRPGAMILDGRDFAVVTAADLAAYTNNADIFVIGQSPTWTAVGTAVAGANAFDYTSVAFTPCFLSDRVVVAVGSNATGTSLLLINLGASFGAPTAAYVNPPNAAVLIQATPIDYDSTGAVANSIISSDIALPSNYAPPAPEGQRTFVGMAAVGATANTDVFRIDFTTAHKLGIATDVDIHSISYSGNLAGGYLVAGAAAVTAPNFVQTWYTNTPMDSFPTWISSAKPPTGTANAFVACAPDFPTSKKVFAGTSDAATAGNESAFSVSTCGGVCFDQISLIDTAINGMSDVMPTPDGTEIFLSTWNAATGLSLESLWRSPIPATAGSWDRVRTSPMSWGALGGAIVRLNPAYSVAQSIYWCDVGAVNIQYSANGGCTFSAIIAPSNIQDLTVESATIVYLASGSNVYKRVGLPWSLPVNVGFNIWTIAMAPTYPVPPMPEHVLVGGTNGEVGCFTPWSTFTPLTTLTVSGNVQVAGDTNYDYVSNGTIYAGSSNGNVYRWDISAGGPWAEINPTIASVSGLAVHCGCLYAADATPAGAGVPPGGADRTRTPTAPAPFWVRLVTGLFGGETFNAVPSALRCSDVPDTDYVALFAIDTAHVALYEYIDTEAKKLEEHFIYSVKFLCGTGSESFGVEPARYATAINIQNFLEETVVLKKKVVVAHREGEPIGTISPYQELSLGPNEAVEVDCVDICELLGGSCGTFQKGFVVIESSKPLNIVAVYTTRSGWGLYRQVSIDVEPISPVVSP